MKFCMECGKENKSPNDRFCGYCGAKIIDAAELSVMAEEAKRNDEVVQPSVVIAAPPRSRKKRGGLIAAVTAIAVIFILVGGMAVYALINGADNVPILSAFLSSDGDSHSTVEATRKPDSERSAGKEIATEAPTATPKTEPAVASEPTLAPTAAPSPAIAETAPTVTPDVTDDYAVEFGEPPSTPIFSPQKQAYLDTLRNATEIESAVSLASSAATGLPLAKLANAAWEEEINRIYGIVRDELPNDEFAVLRLNELAWIKYRDRYVEDVGAAYSDETEREYAKVLVYMGLTKARMYELIDYYFDGVIPSLYAPPDSDGTIQVVRSTLKPGSYPIITVKADIPVRWIINAPEGSINGENVRVIIREYNIEYEFAVGDNVIEFTPQRSGEFQYSSWMGIIRGTITVVE